MSESKNAVVVRRIELKSSQPQPPKKKVRRERPARKQQALDPRVVNQQQIEELKYVKAQLKRAQADVARLGAVAFAAAELVRAIRGQQSLIAARAVDDLEAILGLPKGG